MGAPIEPTEPAQPSAASESPYSLKGWFLGRARQGVQLVDVVLIVAAAGSYYLYSAGLGFRELGLLVLLWFVLWPWWFTRRRAGIVGALFSAVVLSVMMGGPRWQLAFEVERSCFQAKADAALATREPDSTYQKQYSPAGSCGLVDYTTLSTQWVRPRNASDDGADVLVAQFWGAGITEWAVWGGNGLVYSPDGPPYCSYDLVGESDNCDIDALGDDWYAYRSVGDAG